MLCRVFSSDIFFVGVGILESLEAGVRVSILETLEIRVGIFEILKAGFGVKILEI